MLPEYENDKSDSEIMDKKREGRDGKQDLARGRGEHPIISDKEERAFPLFTLLFMTSCLYLH
jgi:hypothetical protein